MKLKDLLTGQPENHLLPFLWVHGEDDATYRKMVRVIDEANIRAFCVEARPHKDFCRENWWRDMDIILDEAEKRGMKVWILDDKHFPTGYAAGLIEEKYPERKIIVIDSLAASAGQGLFVYLAVQNRDKGMNLEENAKALEADLLHVCHWFTVEDLVYLKRGGRISRTTALLGTALNVKPVLHVDNEGHLIKVTQVRGRKKSIRKMAEMLGETIAPHSPIFISHGDCIEDAEMLKEILEKEYNKKVDLITYVGSVIGAHSGPGTLALFFVGTER